jgi:hypothetical protein
MAQDPNRQATADVARLAADEAIDEASDESFPASDPPSTWSGPDAPESERDEGETPG